MVLAAGMAVIDDVVDDTSPVGNAASTPLSFTACDRELASSMIGKRPVYLWICPLPRLMELNPLDRFRTGMTMRAEVVLCLEQEVLIGR